MSRAFRCDGCKEFYDGDPYEIEQIGIIISIIIDRDGEGESADLCARCLKLMETAWTNLRA